MLDGQEDDGQGESSLPLRFTVINYKGYHGSVYGSTLQ